MSKQDMHRKKKILDNKFYREKYVRYSPTLFCPGCGNGVITGALVRAMEDLELDISKTVFVSGIGCSGWIPSPYMKVDSLHVTHGRPVAYATGLKLARPDLNVFVVTGDGDGTMIGTSHLIHAARRNIGLKVILVNNMIYGMTSGQSSATTPLGAISRTTAHGNIDPPIDPSRLMLGAGATFVARWSVHDTKQLRETFKKLILHDGFGFVEVLSACPTYYGRFNKIPDAFSHYKYLKEITSRKDEKGKIKVGIFNQDESSVEYTKRYLNMVEKVYDKEKAKRLTKYKKVRLI